MVVARACERLGWKLSEQRCVVQGFGNVGGIAAQELVDRGATVIAVSDVSGGVFDPDGLDVPTLSAYAREHGSLEGWPTGERDHERAAARARVRHPRARRARGSGSRRQRARACAAASSPRAPTGRRRSKPTRSCASAGSRPAGHPHERGRRHGLVLRVGAGPRPPVLGSRRDPRQAGGEDERRLRPGVAHRRTSGTSRCARRRSSPGFARSRPRSKRAGCTRKVRAWTAFATRW